MAVLGTQVIATLIAVHGAYVMTPLGWGWALFVWVYAIAWFLLNDRLKLLAYKISTLKRPSPSHSRNPRRSRGSMPPPLRRPLRRREPPRDLRHQQRQKSR